MSTNDNTADMLTRMRNALRNREKTVTCLSNKLNRGVAQVLKDEGYINGFELVEDGRQGLIRIDLRYGQRGEHVISRIERVSSSGRRVYANVDRLPRPLQGLGIAIVSTSRGVMSDRKARAEKVGGEVVAVVC